MIHSISLEVVFFLFLSLIDFWFKLIELHERKKSAKAFYYYFKNANTFKLQRLKDIFYDTKVKIW